MNYRMQVWPVLVFIIALVGSSVAIADASASIRGIPLADLRSDDDSIRSDAMKQLRDRLHASGNRRKPLAISEEEVDMLVYVGADLIEHLRHHQRDPKFRKPFSRVISCGELTRDLLCRCESRKGIAFALQHAILFLNAWSFENTHFVKKFQGIDFQSLLVRGNLVGYDQVAVALILSEAATPELLIDLIASGEAKVPMEYHRRGNWKKRFVDTAAFVIATKLDIRRSLGQGPLTHAKHLPIRHNAPAAELAEEVRALAAQIQDPDSGVLRTLSEDPESWH